MSDATDEIGIDRERDHRSYDHPDRKLTEQDETDQYVDIHR